jgi:two-component system osmolarity sensor histidine kinase EnvZ
LGLALAYDAARSHGGNLVLSRSTLGGLRVSVRLPL